VSFTISSEGDEVYAELATCHQVALEDILLARDRRVATQRRLLECCHNRDTARTQITLICFTMNIAGPVKAFGLAQFGFEAGMQQLEQALSEDHCPILSTEKEFANTGYTAYYLVDKDAISIKVLTAKIEDATPLGRLFDLDVLTLDALPAPTHCRKISREEVGLTERRCILCGNRATLCARSRHHSVEQLQRRTIEILLLTPCLNQTKEP
jgi:holo-ACP synthase CitX